MPRPGPPRGVLFWKRSPRRLGSRRHDRIGVSTMRKSVVTLLAIIPAFALAADAGPVPDKNLDAAIKAALPHHKGDLTDQALGNVFVLDASNKGITDLTGLDKCPSLAELRLTKNQVADLKPLAGLKNLQSLTLTGNKIADLAPLAGLTKLQYLEISDNQVADIGPLDKLTALSALYADGNQIADITAVAGLTKLSSLSLNRNKITDIAPVAKLTHLMTLGLRENQVSDLSPLAKLNELSLLMLDKNKIADLAPLVAAAKTDAAGPRRFAPYLRLYLAGNPLSDAAKSEQLGELKKIGVRLEDMGGAAQK